MRTPSSLTRAAAGAVVLAVACAATLLAGGMASAQTNPIGTLSFTPAAGNNLTAPTVTTSAPCPAAANAYYIRLQGPGGSGNLDSLATGRGTAGLSGTAPFSVAFTNAFKDVAAQASPPNTIVAGAYTVSLNCVSGTFGNVVEGSFVSTVTFTTATTYTTSAPVTTTSTALAVTPPSPVAAGSTSTLTATLTPTVATGTVQFFNGSTSLGAPVAVVAGTASTTATLPTGTASLTATFTGGTGFANSTSPVVSSVVNVAAGVTKTTTAVTTSPAPPIAVGTVVTVSAVVSPTTAPGTVQFKDGDLVLGAPVTVTSGAASTSTSTLVVGTHALSALFTPNDPAAFGSSMSPVVGVVVSTVASGVTDTSTAVTASPLSPVAAGTAVTVGATVSPATAPGTVQFSDGAVLLGAPVTVVAGAASTTTTPAVGTHALTAAFTPTDPAFGSSTSVALNLVVTAATGARTTTTRLLVFPKHPFQGLPVVLIARVSSSASTGTVQFMDGSTAIGSPMPVVGGMAIGVTSKLTEGMHSLTAVFTPTDPAAFGPSPSNAVSLKVRRLVGFERRGEEGSTG